MRIQHNISALNSYRQMGTNNNMLSKNLEKLSSGYRINRAGDDAAGLAISEKMRSQIKGLETAQKNANDGISLVQTAEGALTEVHSMLNRMTELATQSANGTYDNDVDRANLQKEVSALLDEIDRIAESTNFNGINLLDGSLSSGTTSTKGVEVDLSNVGVDILTSVADINAIKGVYDVNAFATGALASQDAGTKYSLTLHFTDGDGKEQSITTTLKLSTDRKSFILDDGTADGVELDQTIAGSATGAITQAELHGAFKEALEKNETFRNNFALSGSNTAFKFTALESGSAGAVLNSAAYTSQAPNATKPTSVALGVTVTTKAEDAMKAYDFKNAKIWNNDGKGTHANQEKDLEDAIFEVNGKKFAFVNAALTDADKAALQEAGVEHWVQLGTANGAVTTGDVTNMVDKISKETGLKVEQGTASSGVWTAGATATTVVFKENTAISGKAGQALTLQIGDTAETFNQLEVKVDSMSAKSLGISDIDISGLKGAQAAMGKIKDAINKVSSTRGDLGAVQNRLEHTINNLGVTTENITAAESRIRDTDMASEMMQYTKNNILIQASQAMLAQANQVPQGVLQLLQ